MVLASSGVVSLVLIGSQNPSTIAANIALRFPEALRTVPVMLPSLDSEIRVALDRVLSLAGIRPVIQAEVDDMAMLRLLAREGDGVAVVPPIVVQDELQAGLLIEHCRIPDVTERFYAITQTRRFPNPLLRDLVTVSRSPPAAPDAG